MKNFKKGILFTMMLLGVFIFSSFKNQSADWEHLGTRTVNMTVDHDEILVTAKDGLFTKIKFVVTKAPLHIINCRVVFGNGEDMNVDIKHNFKKGDDSRVIDLPGNKRIIKKIVFNYKTIGAAGKGKAIVKVFGKH